MLTIWGRPNSHNVKKVAWLAEEIGLPYIRHDMGGKFGFTDAYLAMNPNRLIPTMEDDGLVLWESNAILRYLAARYALGLWATDPKIRAIGDKWMDWQFSYADAQRDAFVNLVRRAPDDRDAATIARSAAACAAQMAILDDALAGQLWLSGDQFGVGDIPMGVYAHTWFSLDIDRPDLPHVANWCARLRQRPGFASEVMIPLS
jgi:glutathione S-transferase